jgi:transcriptional regulator with XRE-family HTH domain
MQDNAPVLYPEAERIGATIKSLREAHGWKLGKFATALEMSHSYLSNIEAGRKLAPRPLCARIATLLGVPLAAIISSDYKAARSHSGEEGAA